ncbi:MAG TPA: conjugative transfer signal peptidase TraF [Gemmatimonadaceae bacterium]|jgi:conjugative transfer signal peptidase TraF|nr:conjugative transfer signal peptidase TraF [Gemmatimonadaceae bacterium]
MRRGRRSSRWARSFALGAVIGGAGVAVQLLAHVCGFWINVTASLPIGVYRVAPGPMRRGTLVLACAPVWATQLARERRYLWKGPCPGGTVYLGKQIAAVAGDTVDVDSGGIAVNGAHLANSRPLARDTRGRLLPVLRGRWVLRPGEVWLWAGWNPLSFDGRYFGPSSTGAVRSRISRIM